MSFQNKPKQQAPLRKGKTQVQKKSALPDMHDEDFYNEDFYSEDLNGEEGVDENFSYNKKNLNNEINSQKYNKGSFQIKSDFQKKIEKDGASHVQKVSASDLENNWDLATNLKQMDDSIRPKRLEDFVGQGELRKNLRVYLDATKKRKKAMDHLLFYGNPGLGKTTLAHIIASELGVNIVSTSGPALVRGGDLAAILSNLQANDVFFIDEIHRMPMQVEEVLYPAMEDFKLDLVIGQGPAAKTVKLDIEPFTLIGATTRLGLLSSPLRDRFGIISRLEFYTHAELAEVVTRAARIMGIAISPDGAMEIGKRSRGTPRIANRLLRRVRDFASVLSDSELYRENFDEGDFQASSEKVFALKNSTSEGMITQGQAKHALSRLDVDEMGLDEMDRKILTILIHHYDGGPVGLKTLAVACSEEVRTIEEIYEPYLIQCGLIKRTSKGRVATNRAYKHLGLLC